MSDFQTPRTHTQAPRDEKPPGKEEPLFAHRTGPNGESQQFYNRDPGYQWTLQSPREGQSQRRPQQSPPVQQQEQQKVQSGSYGNSEPAARRFGGRSMHMPGYQGMPGSYGNVRAAVVAIDRMQTMPQQQAQAGSYSASELGPASRATDGAPSSRSTYEPLASQKAMAKAEYLALYESQYNAKWQMASISYTSASSRYQQSMATLQQAQQNPDSYQGSDVGVGSYVDPGSQTMHQQHMRSEVSRYPNGDMSWEDTNGPVKSLYQTTPRPQAPQEAEYRQRAQEDPGHHDPNRAPRRPHREPESDAPLDPNGWFSVERSRSPQQATGKERDQNAVSAHQDVRAEDGRDVVEPRSPRL